MLNTFKSTCIVTKFLTDINLHLHDNIGGITCQNVQALENGEVTMATGTNLLTLGLGSVATYSCNTGFVLLGQTARVCEDTNGGSVSEGTWSESAPTCEGIFVTYDVKC